MSARIHAAVDSGASSGRVVMSDATREKAPA